MSRFFFFCFVFFVGGRRRRNISKIMYALIALRGGVIAASLKSEVLPPSCSLYVVGR